MAHAAELEASPSESAQADRGSRCEAGSEHEKVKAVRAT
jgi:hypothetical protein